MHPAARCFVEGLFGLRPDLPNRRVVIAPQLPSDWDYASVSTKGLTVNATGFRYSSSSSGRGLTTVSVALHSLIPCEACELIVHLPLRAAELTSVMVDGVASSNYTIKPGWGEAVVVVHTLVPSELGSAVAVSLAYRTAIGYQGARNLQAIAGSDVALELGQGGTTFKWEVLSVDDPQGALAAHSVVNGGISAKIAHNYSGFSLICVTLRLLPTIATYSAFDAPVQHRLFKLNITDPVAEAAHKAQTNVSLRDATQASWTSLDLSTHFNGNPLHNLISSVV